MFRSLSLLFTLTLAMSLCQTSQAQFDLGRVLEDEFRQSSREFQGEIRRAVQEHFQPGRIIEPPPVTTLPYPVQPLPYPIVQPHPHPIVKPLPHPIVRPRPCPTPIVGPLPPEHVILPAPGQTAPQPNPAEPSPEVARVEVFAGQVVEIDGADFGEQQGAVFMMIGPMVLQAKLLGWSTEQVQAELPNMPLIEPTPAIVAVMTADQQIAERLQVQLNPAEEQAEETESSAEELPTVELGSELTLEGEELSNGFDSVHVAIGAMRLKAQLLEQSESEITVKVPALSMVEPVNGTIVVLDKNQEVLTELEVSFVPASVPEK